MADDHKTQLSVGIIAAVAVLTGALLGGGFTLLATNRQVEGETERSKAEFLRGQRIEIYGELLTAAEIVVISQRDLAYAYSTNPDDAVTLPSMDNANLSMAYAEHFQQLTAHIAAAEIIGSEDVMAAAQKMMTASERAHTALIEAVRDPTRTGNLRSFVETWINDLDLAREELRDAAREDLLN